MSTRHPPGRNRALNYVTPAKQRKSRVLPPKLSHALKIYLGIPFMERNICILLSYTLPQRSAVIKMCQAQYKPAVDEDCTLARLMRGIPDVEFLTPPTMNDPYRQRTSSPVPFLEHAQDLQLIESPIGAAIILDIARALPLPLSEIEEARYKGWNKELSVMEQSPPAHNFDWSVVLDPSRHTLPLHPYFQSNRDAAQEIYLALYRWREDMSRKLHYPRWSNKSMSRDTSRQAYEFHDLDPDDRDYAEYTQADYLQEYHGSGMLLGGACELRQRWYTSSAKPRTYIAQGGIAYQKSMWTQGFWTELVNSLPFTHHVTRLQPDRLRIKEGSKLRIYDLETFTSRFHEQYSFLLHLSTFCRGYPFSYWDVKQGPITVDMGDMIFDYNEDCNKRTPISFRRVPSLGYSEIGAHHFASALGIYGNLMTCTVPHGIVLRCLSDREDRCNCAGDDGAIEESSDNEEELDVGIKACGKDEVTKRFEAHEAGSICLKRPIAVNEGIITLGIMINPPSVISVAELLYDYSDPRYRQVGLEPFPIDAQRRVGRELFRFLRSVHRGRLAITLTEKKWSLSIAHRISQRWGVVTDVGALSICGDGYSWPALPAETIVTDESVLEYFERDPLVTTAMERYDGAAEIAVRQKIAYPIMPDSVLVGMEFLSNSSDWLRTMVLIGYLEEVETLTTIVTGSLGLSLICQNLLVPGPKVKKYAVIRSIPSQLII